MGSAQWHRGQGKIEGAPPGVQLYTSTARSCSYLADSVHFKAVELWERVSSCLCGERINAKIVKAKDITTSTAAFSTPCLGRGGLRGRGSSTTPPTSTAVHSGFGKSQLARQSTHCLAERCIYRSLWFR